MNRNIFKNSFVVTILLLFILSSSSEVGAFDYDEDIEVYYVEAPLLKAMFGDLLENFKAFHSGVYFYATESKESFTLDYVASPSILGAVFPQVNETTQDIIWMSNGIVQFNTDFNQSYWSSGQQYIMTVNGETFAKYLCWAELYNQTNPFYNLFEVRDNVTLELYLSSSICNDFVWATFEALYNLGGEIPEATTTPPSRDFITLYVTKEPYAITDPEDPATWDQLMSFYEKMQLQPNETAIQFVSSLVQAFSGNFYYYRSQVYYNLSLTAREPLTYSPAALPSGPREPSVVKFAQGCKLPPPLKTHNGIGGGWIFIIVLFSCSTVYIAGGLIYNVQVKGEPLSANALPNYNAWMSLSGYVKDGGLFIVSKVRGGSGVTPGGNYTSSDDVMMISDKTLSNNNNNNNNNNNKSLYVLYIYTNNNKSTSFSMTGYYSISYHNHHVDRLDI
ncbi:hypothetical protein PPL_07670 [Heterostelium album PN500]|uniref:Uncharacterized protein n=1 Tax=Heterostelium pallidum (strain ATCC 26659 / Pp 5 / PN500) TaxID=670386 RepID=D3BGL8_HETP5|nr:hypothetical protein PPL_07670 [Heterostelium album PN500]EFA79252.1 hypothetical protein PPL_07670 [Heterostelium album PN500]|eukprot:XP_020431373.1 hypothetical protein PPL_07670 [Heterostelium album PN500]